VIGKQLSAFSLAPIFSTVIEIVRHRIAGELGVYRTGHNMMDGKIPTTLGRLHYQVLLHSTTAIDGKSTAFSLTSFTICGKTD
jgi:hypothetical protein